MTDRDVLYDANVRAYIIEKEELDRRFEDYVTMLFNVRDRELAIAEIIVQRGTQ